MSEDTQLPMDTSAGDGGELAAASEIPERADEEGTEVNTSQQCGMAAAVEEGEKCQEVWIFATTRSLSVLMTMVEEA
ncbi:uncharacterized protein LOC119976221 isoform X2 [Scyliorhinus canicula]|uniref:uncharacterized protein LOC119976221 isoform X2 n=1 Tax=Scyliorhinus canicula TaxID=7830 RepID=UPI0018F6D52D|nr:uncharacterized protein LOC119976221 isoform X2 [Scyliorhinus canicula]